MRWRTFCIESREIGVASSAFIVFLRVFLASKSVGGPKVPRFAEYFMTGVPKVPRFAEYFMPGVPKILYSAKYLMPGVAKVGLELLGVAILS